MRATSRKRAVYTKHRTAICIACDATIELLPIGVPRRHCDDCRERFVKSKQRAGNKVGKAVYLGRMRPATEFRCIDCDEPAAVWDHRDYRRPFDVEPTCKRCNALRGPAIWDGAKNRPELPAIPDPASLWWSYAPDCGAITLVEARPQFAPVCESSPIYALAGNGRASPRRVGGCL